MAWGTRARRLGWVAVGIAWLAANVAAAPPARSQAHAEPATLGMSEQALRGLFPEPLVEAKVELTRSVHHELREAQGQQGQADAMGADAASKARATPEPPTPAFEGQLRLARPIGGESDVKRVEYDLDAGLVVRIRWQMAERFEQPIMKPLVARLSERFGDPAYDQTVEAKLGSGKATLRRAGWRKSGLGLEVRQLHPKTGGPVYVSVSDLAALQQIVETGRVMLPEPDRTESWWRRPQAPPRLPKPAETTARVDEIEALVGASAFGADDTRRD